MPNAQLLLVLEEQKAKELRFSLANLGYQVMDEIRTNDQALEVIEKECPDLILAGIQEQQGIGGIQFGRQIYKKFSVPVIYISDQSGQTTIRRSGGTAPFGYLFSPIDEKEILATIEVALTRHSLERQMRESKQWLNTIINSISEGLIAVDMDERIRFMNPVAEELTSIKSLYAIDRPLDEVLSLVYSNSDERVTFSHVLSFFQNQNFRTGFDAILLRRDGIQIPVEIFVSELNDNDVQVGMVLTFQDISERKRTMEDVRRHALHSEAMLTAAKQMNSSLDVDSLLGKVCEICNHTLGTTATSAFLRDTSSDMLISKIIVVNRVNNTYSFETDSFGSKFEIPLELIQSFLLYEKPIVAIKDIQLLDTIRLPYLNKIHEMDVRSLALAGMYQNKALVGILVAQMYGTVRKFTEEELDLLRGLADQASIAIGNATLFEQIIASRERQQALTRRLVAMQENERRSLARELHDQIGQTLTGLQFSLNSLREQASDEQKREIASAQNVVKDLIAQTREISINLRPTMLEDTGLVLTLIWHFDRFSSQTNIEVKFRHHNILERRFTPEIEIAVYRIVQEALTNIARHAKTDSVSITLQFGEKKIKIEIVDQGRGFNPDTIDTTAHMGLSSMRERAYVVGGLMEINSTPGIGTRIHAEIPLSGSLERRLRDRKSVTG